MGVDINERGFGVRKAAEAASNKVKVDFSSVSSIKNATSKEVESAIAKVMALNELATRRQKLNMLRNGAEIIQSYAKQLAPVSDRPHKARNGTWIMPGNLIESISVMSFRKSDSLWVGPKTRSAATASVFGVKAGNSGAVDGYYAHWVEFDVQEVNGGTRRGKGFMRRAASLGRQQAYNVIVKDAAALFLKIVKKAKTRKT